MPENPGGVNFVFDQLRDLLHRLNDRQYAATLPLLSGATIGKHVRHIIEFFQCIRQADGADFICYDDRPRNQLLETNRMHAEQVLRELQLELAFIRDRPLLLKGDLDPGAAGPKWRMQTSLLREFYYAVEHAIHHMAIIKMGVLSAYPDVNLPDEFGVAPSTLRYERHVDYQ